MARPFLGPVSPILFAMFKLAHPTLLRSKFIVCMSARMEGDSPSRTLWNLIRRSSLCLVSDPLTLYPKKSNILPSFGPRLKSFQNLYQNLLPIASAKLVRDEDGRERRNSQSGYTSPSSLACSPHFAFGVMPPRLFVARSPSPDVVES